MKPNSVKIVSQPTTSRQTPAPRSRNFRSALEATADNVLVGAVSLVPGASMLTASVRRANGTNRASQAITSAGTARPASARGAAAAPTSAFDQAFSGDALSASEQAAELLALQKQISDEQRHYQTLSNVLKAKHDTSKSVIQNLT